MEIHPILDTFMNVEVFAFIGVMIWLYLREEPGDRHSSDSDPGDGDPPGGNPEDGASGSS